MSKTTKLDVLKNTIDEWMILCRRAFQKIDHLNDHIKWNDTCVKEIGDKTSELEERINTLENQLSNYQRKIDILDDTLDAVCEDVSKIKLKLYSGRFPWGENKDADNELLTRENVLESLTDDELSDICVRYGLSMYPMSKEDMITYPIVISWSDVSHEDSKIHRCFFSNEEIMSNHKLADAISNLMSYVPGNEEEDD